MESEPTLTSLSLSIRDCKDSLSSLHHRIDRFYAWASQLQVEHRDLKQRVGFVEGIMLDEDEDESLKSTVTLDHSKDK
jgi:hypothetical protein